MLGEKRESWAKWIRVTHLSHYPPRQKRGEEKGKGKGRREGDWIWFLPSSSYLYLEKKRTSFLYGSRESLNSGSIGFLDL